MNDSFQAAVGSGMYGVRPGIEINTEISGIVGRKVNLVSPKFGSKFCVGESLPIRAEYAP